MRIRPRGVDGVAGLHLVNGVEHHHPGRYRHGVIDELAPFLVAAEDADGQRLAAGRGRTGNLAYERAEKLLLGVAVAAHADPLGPGRAVAPTFDARVHGNVGIQAVNRL